MNLFSKLFRRKLVEEKIWNSYLEKSTLVSPSRLNSKHHTLIAFCDYYNNSDKSIKDAAECFVAEVYRSRLAGATKRGIAGDLRIFLRLLGIMDINTPPAKKDTISHQAFTLDELQMLVKNSSGWIRHILIMGACSGLRKKDICFLKWDSIDLKTGWIRRVTCKTSATVKIPILPLLRKHLELLPDNDAYVSPDLVRMYEHDPSAITYHFIRFLQKNKLTVRIRPDHRTQAVNLKGIHSLRHSFVYLAAVNKIPWPVIQSITGHASRKMLQVYMDHATEADTMHYMAAFPDIEQETH